MSKTVELGWLSS